MRKVWRTLRTVFNKKVRFGAPKARWGFLRLLVLRRIILQRLNKFKKGLNGLRLGFRYDELRVSYQQYPLVFCCRGISVDSASVIYGPFGNGLFTTPKRKFGIGVVGGYRSGLLFGGAVFIRTYRLIQLVQSCLQLKQKIGGPRVLVETVGVRAGNCFSSSDRFLSMVGSMPDKFGVFVMGGCSIGNVLVGMLQVVEHLLIKLVVAIISSMGFLFLLKNYLKLNI